MMNTFADRLCKEARTVTDQVQCDGRLHPNLLQKYDRKVSMEKLKDRMHLVGHFT